MKHSEKQEVKPEAWEKAKAMKLAGDTWPVISAAVGIPQGTLRAKYYREGMPKLEKRIEAERVKNPLGIPQIASEAIEDISRRVRDLLAADSLATSIRVAQYDPQDIREEGMREQVMGSLVKRSAQVLGWESASSTVQVQVGVIASLPDRPTDSEPFAQ